MRRLAKKAWPRVKVALALGKFLYRNRRSEIALVSSLAALASEIARYFH